MICIVSHRVTVFGLALDALTPNRSISQTGDRFVVHDPDTLTDNDRAAIRALVREHGGTIEGEPGPADARLWSFLSPTQRLVPLDELVWDTLRGVVEIVDSTNGFKRRRRYVDPSDLESTPAILVEYRYVDGWCEARIRYPLADGSGDVLVVEPQKRGHPAGAPPEGWEEWP